MSRILDTLRSEGFTSTIELFEAGEEIVRFTADADIDADGANGQNGRNAAYKVGDVGSEALANGGMGMRGGKVVGITDWFKDIVILGPDGQPKMFPGGVIASKTSYRLQGRDKDDPTAYLDSATVRYIVVPPIISQKTAGAVMGCHCTAMNIENGRIVEGVVGDTGPRSKIGEVSIAMAQALGIPFSPRVGGTDKPIISYAVYPGKPGTINGIRIPLMRANGQYIPLL